MGDRWMPKDLAKSPYVWLPFEMKEDGGFEIRWKGNRSPGEWLGSATRTR